jgi:hypothetical protein
MEQRLKEQLQAPAFRRGDYDKYYIAVYSHLVPNTLKNAVNEWCVEK